MLPTSLLNHQLEEEEAIPEGNLPPLQKEKLKKELKQRAAQRVRREEAERVIALKKAKEMLEIDEAVLSRIHSILLCMRYHVCKYPSSHSNSVPIIR